MADAVRDHHDRGAAERAGRPRAVRAGARRRAISGRGSSPRCSVCRRRRRASRRPRGRTRAVRRRPAPRPGDQALHRRRDRTAHGGDARALRERARDLRATRSGTRTRTGRSSSSWSGADGRSSPTRRGTAGSASRSTRWRVPARCSGPPTRGTSSCTWNACTRTTSRGSASWGSSPACSPATARPTSSRSGVRTSAPSASGTRGRSGRSRRREACSRSARTGTSPRWTRWPGSTPRCTRAAPDGTGAWNLDERVDLATALRASTWGSAWSIRAEAERGTLTPGTTADVVGAVARPRVEPITARSSTPT